MDQVKKWGARDEGQPRSVREILRNERSAGRLLVRQIYREQTKDAVRSKIARMMRRKNEPWYSVEDESSAARDVGSS